MHYKTIILELLQERPALYERLRSSKMLLTTMDDYAIQLKALHESWIKMIRREEPDTDPRQVASHALELAILGIHDGLLSESPKGGEADSFPLEAAMAFVRRATPNA
jgi:hypothetical protein